MTRSLIYICVVGKAAACGEGLPGLREANGGGPWGRQLHEGLTGLRQPGGSCLRGKR